MPHLSTKTTFLEMFEPPVETAPPRSDLNIERIWRPSNEFYRRLYRAVGADFHWVDRLVIADEQLQAVLTDDRVEILVLSVANETAGYAELDRRQPNEIELAYFGLVARFIGQGLGKYFLNCALRTAWSYRPSRVWVHTCDLDHPAALPTYLKAGFRVYYEQIVSQFVPDDPSKAFESAESAEDAEKT
jgi:GNAT superfamily N-acetyltransferase